jgi:TonB-dependent starch-binding outer membrane protein SusC
MMKKLYRFLGISVLILLVCLKVSAQSQAITGKVKDSFGSALPGVNVLIKGTTIGTVTDADGVYSVSAGPDAILVFSFIGFTPQEFLVGQQTSIDVTMIEDLQTLNEVVVIGYGEVKRGDVTGSISSVKGDDLKRTNISTLEQALQGRVPGMVIQQVSGQPGGGVSVQIRGITSLGGASPLYVIDGVRIKVTGTTDAGINPLAGINASEIESIEVLKDASATAIYGNQATDGVILITTKRGKLNSAPVVSYQGYTGFQQLVQRLPVMNLQEHATFLNARAAEPTWNFDARPEFANPQYLGEGTDWQGALFRTSQVSEHSVSLNGGDEKTRYYLSGTFYQNDGIAFGSKFNRTSVRLNLDNQTNKWLKIGTSLQFVNIDEKTSATSWNLVGSALSITPDVPIQNNDGSWGGVSNQNGWIPPTANPFALAKLNKDETNRKQVYANAFAEVNIVKGLVLKNLVGGNFSIANRDKFSPSYTMGKLIKGQADGSAEYSDFNHTEMSTTLTYSHSFADKYRLTAMGAHESQLNMWRGVTAWRTNFPTNTIETVGGGDPATATNDANKFHNSVESYFGRLDVSYNDRYQVTGNARYDGDSRYARENRWILTYSGVLAWKINNESFFANVNNVNELKLRVSTGLTNRAGGRDYAYASTLNSMSTGIGGGGVAMVNNDIGNPDLKWEQTHYNNIGLDGAFFNSRVSFSVDFYERKTKDLVMQLSLPMYSGTQLGGWPPGSLLAPYVNIGSMNNKGFDFRISTDNVRGKNFTWKTDLNVSHNKNKIVKLNAEGASITGGSGYNRTVAGRSIGEFYGYVVEGVFADSIDFLGDEANGILPHARPVRNGDAISIGPEFGSIWYGDLKFKDLNGDGIIDERDQKFLGSPIPKVQLGLNNTFTYKNFDLTIFFTSNIGNKVYNVTRKEHEDPQGNSAYFKNAGNYAKLALIDPNGEASDVGNVYVTNADTNIPGLRNDQTNGNRRVTDLYVEDGSFVKCKNISLGYTIPGSLSQKMHLRTLKVYASATNVFTITKYSGMDPEIGSWDPTNAGIDNGYYPQPRMITFGLNLSL